MFFYSLPYKFCVFELCLVYDGCSVLKTVVPLSVCPDLMAGRFVNTETLTSWSPQSQDLSNTCRKTKHYYWTCLLV